MARTASSPADERRRGARVKIHRGVCEDGIQALHYFFLVSVSIVMSDQGLAALPTLGARIIRGNRRRRTEIARIRALGREPRQVRGLPIRTEQRKHSENKKHKFGLWMGRYQEGPQP